MAVGQHRILLDRAREFSETFQVPDSFGPFLLAIERETGEFTDGCDVGSFFEERTQDPKCVAIAFTFERL